MLEDDPPNNQQPRKVGAPTVYADAEEVPDWFATLVKGLFTVPILVGVLCGGVPFICSIIWYILQVAS